MLLLLDYDLSIYLFDLTRLRHEAAHSSDEAHNGSSSPHKTTHLGHSNSAKDMSMLKGINLIRDCHFFDHNLIKHEDH
jgi:hypothetical protein